MIIDGKPLKNFKIAPSLTDINVEIDSLLSHVMASFADGGRPENWYFLKLSELLKERSELRRREINS